MANSPSIQIINQNIDNLTASEALESADNAIHSRRYLSIATVNPEIIVLSARSKTYAGVLSRLGLRLPDGIGLTLMSRLFGKAKFKERIPGVDFVKSLLVLAEKKGYKVLMLGAGIASSLKAEKILRRQYPNLAIKCLSGGVIDPYNADQHTIEQIKSFNPDILIVGLGAPKQETFILNYQKKLGAYVAIGAGGTIDYLAGQARRAPRIIRRLGLEWLWRLLLYPSRWRRILTATIVFPFLYLKWRHRFLFLAL